MEIWRKNLYTIWFAQFLTMAGMNLVIPFLPFYVRELGVTDENAVASWSGLVFAGPFFLSLFLTPLWGTLGDKYGRKLMVIRAIIGLGISQILIALSPNVYFLLIFRIIQGAISGFIPSALALVSSTTPNEKSGYAIGLLQSSTAAGTILGPLAGGLLADFLPYKTIFLITAGLCFFAGALIIKIVKENRTPKNEPEYYTVIDNLRFVFVNKNLRHGVTLIFISQLAVMLIQPIFALYIESFKMNKSYISTYTGFAFSILGIFMLISSPLWGRRIDNKGYKKNLPIAFIGASVAYLIQGLINSVFLLITFRAIQGIFMGGIIPSLYSYISKNCNQERRAGIMGIGSSLFVLANLIGPISGGMLASGFGFNIVFFISSFILFIPSLYLLQNLKEPNLNSQ